MDLETRVSDLEQIVNDLKEVKDKRAAHKAAHDKAVAAEAAKANPAKKEG